MRYEGVAWLDHYWQDLYRPELFWRSFRRVTRYERDTEAIYVFRRLPVAAAPPP